MATGASPDDHAAMVKWYQTHDQKTGYDLEAHKTILAAYEKFLDDHGFRQAFPTAETLFREAGAKHYFSAAHVLENARMSNDVDYIVLSGWESTAVENHSGLVDSLRLLKADPALLHQASQPEVLVIRPRHYVVAKGDTAVVDVHQINEKNLDRPLAADGERFDEGTRAVLQRGIPGRVEGRRDLRPIAQSRTSSSRRTSPDSSRSTPR